MEKQEYRILIKHCFLMRKTPEQLLKWLQKCYPISVPSRTTVYQWFNEFKMAYKHQRRTSLWKTKRDYECGNRKVKLRELAEAGHLKRTGGIHFTR